MFRDQRENLAHPGFLGVYLIVGLFGAHAEDRHAILLSLVVIAAIAFFAWMMSLRRLLAMSGTPTSRIASAAQGYVELVGSGRNHPDFQVLSRLTYLPCIWYRFVVEQRNSKNKWERVSSGRSDESFILHDGSGLCIVDPDHAEVIPRKKEVWTRGDFRYTEWLILPQETIYVLGEFSTLSGATADLDLKRDVGDLLAEWKRNQPQLLARFDLDKDGSISDKEWALARSQAKREVRKTHNDIRTQPGTNVLHKPRDGRLFLISNVDPEKLARRYRLWAWVHLVAFVGAVGGASWLSTMGGW
jgi:hypothetical protein